MHIKRINSGKESWNGNSRPLEKLPYQVFGMGWSYLWEGDASWRGQCRGAGRPVTLSSVSYVAVPEVRLDSRFRPLHFSSLHPEWVRRQSFHRKLKQGCYERKLVFGAQWP